MHDLLCRNGHLDPNVLVEAGKLGKCPACGSKRQIDWSHGKPPSTDVYGVSQFSTASGREHSSQREKEKYMRLRGFQVAGDRVKGAPYSEGATRQPRSFASHVPARRGGNDD